MSPEYDQVGTVLYRLFDGYVGDCMTHRFGEYGLTLDRAFFTCFSALARIFLPSLRREAGNSSMYSGVTYIVPSRPWVTIISSTM